MDKYIDVLRHYQVYDNSPEAKRLIPKKNREINTEHIAKELHDLRYEVARQVIEEYFEWKSEWNGDYPDIREHTELVDWLSEQGEDISIGGK